MNATATYNGRTADEYRAMAAAKSQRSRDSFDRCDTDGFLSQWASDTTASLHRVEAELAENNGKAEFPALFDLDGNLVAAKLIDGRYGSVWGVLASDDPRDNIVAWVSRSNAAKATTRAKNLAKKGYTEGAVLVEAGAKLYGASATSVAPLVYRKDGGFSRDVEVVATSGTDSIDW